MIINYVSLPNYSSNLLRRSILEEDICSGKENLRVNPGESYVLRSSIISAVNRDEGFPGMVLLAAALLHPLRDGICRDVPSFLDSESLNTRF